MVVDTEGGVSVEDESVRFVLDSSCVDARGGFAVKTEYV